MRTIHYIMRHPEYIISLAILIYGVFIIINILLTQRAERNSWTKSRTKFLADRYFLSLKHCIKDYDEEQRPFYGSKASTPDSYYNLLETKKEIHLRREMGCDPNTNTHNYNEYMKYLHTSAPQRFWEKLLSHITRE